MFTKIPFHNSEFQQTSFIYGSDALGCLGLFGFVAITILVGAAVGFGLGPCLGAGLS